jgi:hypothetical protein
MKKKKAIAELKGNPSIQFETLAKEPVNLFIKSELINKNSPPIQLELKGFKNGSSNPNFLWPYKASSNPLKTSYPCQP